ncbi:hypothetical protein XM38_018460 [Halomicronema hongdechloris C2206]|uniref:Uncharacterized protein n=1 Tax=Halomicronema hongdechloris C2206 TaxID=1641165 RepID=A0A1Z3HKS4_9CYAN|nr:hypothetical protein [Halomicronema hongdechloris]ASC70898.1 hypothetical protein XM38_018460 [Halomicronema hongdechloris C2206]
MALRNNDINHAQTRFLLALWALGGNDVKKGDLMPFATRGDEKSSDFQPIIDKLDAKDVIKITNNKFSITTSGLNLLHQCLQNQAFEYDGNVGARTVNALLRWIRAQGQPSLAMNGNGRATEPISSYEEFTEVASEIFDQLNRDYNLDNFVPIYRIRRHIGERVSRSQFNDWMLEMQANDMFEFLEGSVEDSAPDKIEDSITTKFGKLRCYAKRLKR